MKQPTIPVSEISRILVNLRKSYLKKFNACQRKSVIVTSVKLAKLATIDEARKSLGLRRRSREGVVLPRRR